MKKKSIIYAILILAVALLQTACGDDTLVTFISLSQQNVDLMVGESKVLSATINPSDADNPAVTWTSNNFSVASVDQTGKVTAKTVGSCTITCSATDGSGVYAECKVTVYADDPIIGVWSGVIDHEECKLTFGSDGTAMLLSIDDNAMWKYSYTKKNKEYTMRVTSRPDGYGDDWDQLRVEYINENKISVYSDFGDGHDRLYGTLTRNLDDQDGHEYVDLGLPSGTLWAKCNVGANTPWGYGDYFACGETVPKEEYTWSTYKYCKGTFDTMTKYCQNSNWGYNGYTDNLTELLPEDDAATANWGDNWQIPSRTQILELLNESYTTAEWTQMNGVNGVLFTSKNNGKSIFLPAAGGADEKGYYHAGKTGCYWSRSRNTGKDNTDNRAGDLFFEKHGSRPDIIGGEGTKLFEGQSIRPVRKK